MKRRDFFKRSIPAAAAASFMLDGFSINAFARSPLFAQLAAAAGTGRVLVMVQLDGGNDGLNTIVPIESSVYYNKRPTIGIAKADALKLDNHPTLGFHPSMTGFNNLYKDGKLAVLMNVGYAQPNRSHFRSTDIMVTASDANVVLDTGWLGRYLDTRFPGYPNNAPANPLAIQISTALSLAFQGPNVGMGMAIRDVEQFYQLIQGTDLSGFEEPPQTRAGDELRYIRKIATESFGYSKPVRDAYNAAINNPGANYPTYDLADQFKIVARLIAGGLETPIYMVRIGGFDTHANQIVSGSNKTGQHANLLNALSGSVAAFLEDCKLNGIADRVLVATFSEFGRRVNENGTLGTDHGTCLPQFVAGTAAKGGVFGKDPDLVNLDGNQDLKYDIDYRVMYASILEQWFGVSNANIKKVLDNKDFTTLPIITGATGVNDYNNAPGSYALEQNYPNPFNPSTRIRFTVKSGDVELKVFDVQGREITTLVNGTLQSGEHEVIFNPKNIPSGTYFYRLRANGYTETKAMTLVK